MADLGTASLPPALPPRMQRLRAGIVPYGGGRRAALFAGPRDVTIRGREIVAHENAACLPDGRLSLERVAEFQEGTVFALPAGPAISLGGFLTGSLPGILAALPYFPEAGLAGPRPTAAQMGVLARLGLTERHIALDAPRGFSRVLESRAAPAHGAPAEADMLALVQMLRDPAAVDVPERVAILPWVHKAGFALRNRASLCAWLRARRVRLLEPETAPFEATAAGLSRATQIIIADARDAGLLGLCSSGTRILEIAPEGWACGKIRALCATLGLEWRLFLASAPSYPVLRPLPVGAVEALGYEIPIAALCRALESM